DPAGAGGATRRERRRLRRVAAVAGRQPRRHRARAAGRRARPPRGARVRPARARAACRPAVRAAALGPARCRKGARVSATPADSRSVREEDAFDVGAVDGWLRGCGLEALGAVGELPEVRQFTGGASNLTYLLRYPHRELILRRPPAGTKASSAHDMAREHRTQAALQPVFPQVPAMLCLCTDHAVLGSDFYVMERVEGVIPRAQMPPQVGTDPELMRRLGER